MPGDRRAKFERTTGAGEPEFCSQRRIGERLENLLYRLSYHHLSPDYGRGNEAHFPTLAQQRLRMVHYRFGPERELYFAK